ncbi:MAG: FAD-dependent monooxygenase, partial [Gammaproteobacteria bacterium]|nr:FAD-dependent monooxygenase [Gammaproteobacteria bacterium]
LAGIYLERLGFGVAIYECRPDMRKVELPAGRSINLALANRGINALSKAGLMEQVNKHLIPMHGRMIHDEGGNVQMQPYGNRPDEVIYSVSRSELNKIMMDTAEAAGVTINFNQRCQTIDFKNKRMVFFDETTSETHEESYEITVGADGGGSAMRGAIVEFTRGHVTEDILSHGYKELIVPPGPNGEFMMERNVLHIWPRGGYMLIALPNSDGSFTVTLFLPNEGKESFASLQSKENVEMFFKKRFGDVLPLLTNLADNFIENPTGMLGTIRCLPWHYNGDAVLIGDAAHAIVPFHGQGMNAGFEDCVTLNQYIERYGTDWSRVFAEFENDRKPNAEAIADMALENYIEMRDSVRDPSFLLKKELAWKLEELYPSAFIPRYSMVMFHLVPYAQAYRRGMIQAEILDELTRSATSIEDVDFDRARGLIKERL